MTKQHTWWIEHAPAVYQYVMYPLHAFIEQSRYFHPKYLTICYLLTKGDYFYEVTSEEEKYKVYQYIFRKVKKDNNYLQKKKQAGDTNKSFMALGRFFEQQKEHLTNQQFWEVYQAYADTNLDYVRYSVTLECVDIFSSYYLEKLVWQELPMEPVSAIKNITSTLATPAHLSFMEQERIAFLKVCLGLYSLLWKNKKVAYESLPSKNWRARIKKLSDDYFWVQNNFAATRYLTPQVYFQEIKKEVRNKAKKTLAGELAKLQTKKARLIKEQKKLLKKRKLSKDLKLHFKIVRFLGEWIDDRKKHMIISNHYYSVFCDELARRFKLASWVPRYYLPEDYKRLLLKDKRLDFSIAQKRRTQSAYVIYKQGQQAKVKIFYGRQAKQLFKKLVFKNTKQQELRGHVASAPVKRCNGRVQVITDVSKQKFVTGRILVTSMTRPEFVPYMRRAKAILTDEGGLTCHAAIVSRELGIPCIIGTKQATNILRSGEKVVMDLEQGIVKKA